MGSEFYDSTLETMSIDERERYADKNCKRSFNMLIQMRQPLDGK